MQQRCGQCWDSKSNPQVNDLPHIVRVSIEDYAGYNLSRRTVIIPDTCFLLNFFRNNQDILGDRVDAEQKVRRLHSALIDELNNHFKSMSITPTHIYLSSIMWEEVLGNIDWLERMDPKPRDIFKSTSGFLESVYRITYDRTRLELFRRMFEDEEQFAKMVYMIYKHLDDDYKSLNGLEFLKRKEDSVERILRVNELTDPYALLIPKENRRGLSIKHTIIESPRKNDAPKLGLNEFRRSMFDTYLLLAVITYMTKKGMEIDKDLDTKDYSGYLLVPYNKKLPKSIFQTQTLPSSKIGIFPRFMVDRNTDLVIVTHDRPLSVFMMSVQKNLSESI